MGNSSSFSDLDSQRIVEIAMEANQQFSKDFLLCFQDSIARTIKATYMNSKQNRFRLQQFDSPVRDIKVGYLEKLGGQVKSWHRRYFVASNKGSNYQVVYYDDVEHRREKGSINCCGYRAEVFDEQDILKYGPHGIKLVPYSPSKRQWYFKASKESEQLEWIETFSNACKKAAPCEPAVLESIYQVSFLKAFKLTKAAYGFFGVSAVFGTMPEMLESLVTQLLHREVLESYIMDHASSSSQSSDTAHSKALQKSVQQYVQKIVRPMVTKTWSNVYRTASEMRGGYELQVKTSLGLIMKKEDEVIALLDKRIQRIVHPFFEELETTVCVPVLSCCFEDIVQSYAQSLIGMHDCFLRLIITPRSNQLSLQSISAELQSLESVIESTISCSPLTTSQRLLWTMQQQDVSDIQEILDASGMLPQDIYSDVMIALKHLCHNANYTLRMTLSTAEATESNIKVDGNDELIIQTTVSRSMLLEKLSTVMLQMEHDAAESLHQVVSQLLKHSVESTVQESMIAPCYEEVLSAKQLIGRDVEHLINLNMVGEELVRGQVDVFINTVISDQMKDARARLRQISSTLCNEAFRQSMNNPR